MIKVEAVVIRARLFWASAVYHARHIRTGEPSHEYLDTRLQAEV